MATQTIKLSEKFSRLVSSAPNITLGELEHQRENEIHLLKQYQSHVELSSAFTKTILTNLNDENSNNPTKVGDFSKFTKPSLKYYAKLLLAATLLLFLGFFTGFQLNGLIFSENMKQYDEQPKHKNNQEQIKTDHVSQTTLPNTLLQPVEILANSYTEYQANIYSIPDHQPVSVVIQLKSPENWPKQAELARAEQVTILKISGNYSFEMISFILSSLYNLVSLTIISNENQVYKNEGGFELRKSGNLMLLRLRHLVLLNFTKYSYIFDMFANSPSISSIRQLKIENGVVNQVNVELIRAIVSNNRHSLRKLCFPDTRWETTLLDKQFPSLTNLTLLRMDFITVSSAGLGYINTKLATKLPNLKSFISVKGFSSWNDFRNILNSNNLEMLRCGIQIPKDRNEFKLNFLDNEFLSLKEVYLSLNFVRVNNSSSGCSIYGIDSLRSSLKTLEIQTTCEIHLNRRQSFASKSSL